MFRPKELLRFDVVTPLDATKPWAFFHKVDPGLQLSIAETSDLAEITTRVAEAGLGHTIAHSSG